MNCTQVQEQLIDFLYGELPSEARSAFTEHLQGCPACKADVASYQSTLGSARAALGGPLFEEAPARVHLAVMAAATAAAKQAAQVKDRPPTSRDDLGVFARLWRTPWFLPAFGAASIATVVFLVRVIKNPEVLPGQRPQSIDERALVAPAPVPPPEPAMAAKPTAATATTAETDNSLDEADEAKGTISAGSAHKRVGAKAGKARAQAWGSGGGDRPRATEFPQGLGGLRVDEGRPGAGAQRQFAQPPPPPQAAGKKSIRDIDDLLGGFNDAENMQRRAQPIAAPAPGMAAHASGDEARHEVQAEKVASPPPKAPQYAPAAPMAKPAAAPASRMMRDYPAESAASAPAPARTPSLRRKEMQQEEEAQGFAKADSDDVSQDLAKDKKAQSGGKAGPSLDESLRKAERLYATQDWSAAAAAYRDLINRFPSHMDAPRWRARMNESNAAYQRTLEAKRKKAISDDPLSGSKM